MAEQVPFKHKAAGSSPARPTGHSAETGKLVKAARFEAEMT